MERDRILFQRQRVSTVAEIQPQGGIGTLITTQQIDNKQLCNYQRRYSTNSRYNNRKISNYSSGRFVFWVRLRGGGGVGMLRTFPK